MKEFPQRRRRFSVEKVVITFLEDTEGIILVAYLERGKAITEAYYAVWLTRSKDESNDKTAHIGTQNVYFVSLAQLATSQISVAAAKLYALGIELVPRHPYYPEFVPCDAFLFQSINMWLGGKEFTSNEDAIDADSDYFSRV